MPAVPAGRLRRGPLPAFLPQSTWLYAADSAPAWALQQMRAGSVGRLCHPQETQRAFDNHIGVKPHTSIEGSVGTQSHTKVMHTCCLVQRGEVSAEVGAGVYYEERRAMLGALWRIMQVRRLYCRQVRTLRRILVDS